MGVFWGDALTSFRPQEIQDQNVLLYSCLSQNIFCCRLLAFELLSIRGEVSLKRCQRSLDFLKNPISCPYSVSEHWMKMNSQIARVLNWLKDPDILNLFYSIGLPGPNSDISKVILDTCFDSNNISENLPCPSLYQVRFAILVSWMSYLGPGNFSGPFTVPLKHLHEKYPNLFLLDVKYLIEDGVLQRNIYGSLIRCKAKFEHLSVILSRRVRYTHEMSYLTPLAVSLSMSGVFKEHDPIAIRDCFEKYIFEWAHEKDFSFDEIIRHVLIKMYGLSNEMVKCLSTWPKGLIPKDLVIESNANRLFWDARLVLDHEKLSCSLFRRLCQSDLLCIWKDTLISLITCEQKACQNYLQSGLGIDLKKGIGILVPFEEWTKDRLDQLKEEKETLEKKISLLEDHCQEVYLRSTQVNERAAQWMKAELASLTWDKSCYAKQGDHILSRMKKLDSFQRFFKEICSENLSHVFFLERIEKKEISQHFLFPCLTFCLKGYLRGVPQYISDWSLFAEVISEWLLFCQKETSLRIQGLDPLDDRDLTDLAIKGCQNEFLAQKYLERFKSFSTSSNISNSFYSFGEFSFKVSFEECCRLIFNDEFLQEIHSFCEEIDDFWVFLMDSVEKSATFFFESCEKNKDESLILSSPQAVLLFRPGTKRFFQGILDEIYPYSWIRDFFFLPSREKYCVKLNPVLQRKIISSFLSQKKLLRKIWAERVISEASVCPFDMRKRLENILSKSPYRKDILMRFDSFLFKKLPIFSFEEIKKFAEQIKDLGWFEKKNLRFSVEYFMDLFLEVDVFFYDTVWGSLVHYICTENQNIALPIRFFEDLLQICVNVNFFPIPPIPFADALIFGYDLAFVFNPGMDRLEVWNVRGLPYEGFATRDELNFYGSESNSMEWKIFLRGHSEICLNNSS